MNSKTNTVYTDVEPLVPRTGAGKRTDGLNVLTRAICREAENRAHSAGIKRCSTADVLSVLDDALSGGHKLRGIVERNYPTGVGLLLDSHEQAAYVSLLTILAHFVRQRAEVSK